MAKYSSFFILLVLLIAPELKADEPTTYSFITVDSFRCGYDGGGDFSITGILDEETTPTKIEYRLGNSADSKLVDRCERRALLAMSKPGHYRFIIKFTYPSPAYANIIYCTLERM